MRKHLFYLSMVLVLTLFSACGGGKKGVFTPTSSGRAYEVLVVVEPGLWERPAGRALFDVLDSDVPGLPQSERSFRIMYTAPSNYDATLKLIRNIIIVDVNKDLYTQPKFKYARNVYAAPQSILTIQAPDEASFEKFVEENRQVIIDFFTHAEMNRQISVLKDKHSDYIATKVKSQFDCDVWVPGELTSTKEGENFFWAGTNAATGDQNFVIYSYPYTDKDTFTKEYFVMTDVRPISVQGDYALEARGLWRIKGDFMGGPFVSHVRLDKANQRIIVSEIFIYSPDKMKRNLVRQMEASLYTLKLPGSKLEGAEIPVGVTAKDTTNNK